MQLSQKEMSYLKDAEKQEQLCVDLYQRYSQMASDQQLAQLLQTIASQEQQHLQSIMQLQQGQIPNTTGSQSGNQQQSSQQSGQVMSASGGLQMQSQSGQSTQQVSNQFNQQSPDRQACEELLSIEKSVSDLYDHAVFEFTNHQARAALDHIQAEEHHHGFMLWQYMNQQGWYQAQ